MTVPAGAGQPFTLVPGAPARLLTEYAGGARATQVINLDPAGPRIYLSSNSQLSPASGVPVDPGTASPWSPTGQLWAIADPAGTKNASIVLTSAVNDWTPSPAAIAAQVAAQLLAQGVPTVLTSTLIATALDVAIPVTLDVHAYATLQLFQNPNGPPLVISWRQSTSDVVATDLASVNPNGGLILPVLAPKLVLQSFGGGSTAIDIYGTNESIASTHPLSGGFCCEGMQWGTGNVAKLANTDYPLNLSNGAPFAGPAYAYIESSGAVVTGQLKALTIAGNARPIADTAEMITMANGNKGIYKLFALPQDFAGFTFHCTGAGTNNVQVFASPNY